MDVFPPNRALCIMEWALLCMYTYGTQGSCLNAHSSVWQNYINFHFPFTLYPHMTKPRVLMQPRKQHLLWAILREKLWYWRISKRKIVTSQNYWSVLGNKDNMVFKAKRMDEAKIMSLSIRFKRNKCLKSEMRKRGGGNLMFSVTYYMSTS